MWIKIHNIYKVINFIEMEQPKQLETINLEKLRNICQDYINFIDNDEEYHEDNDYKEYIFEAAMETVFGKEVWTYVNNRRYS